MKVFVNPGHSKQDPGAIGCSKVMEAELVARVGDLVVGRLKEYGWEIHLLQHDSLEYICREANASKANVFVSIHANAFSDSNVNGVECYSYYESKRGAELAWSIQKMLLAKLPLRDRGTKTAGFYVLCNTDMPACLVEMAFVSNPRDEWLLRSRQGDFAEAIAQGIINYGEGLYGKRTESVYKV